MCGDMAHTEASDTRRVLSTGQRCSANHNTVPRCSCHMKEKQRHIHMQNVGSK